MELIEIKCWEKMQERLNDEMGKWLKWKILVMSGDGKEFVKSYGSFGGGEISG